MYDPENTSQSHIPPHFHAGKSNSSAAQNNAPQAHPAQSDSLLNLTNEHKVRSLTSMPVTDVAFMFEKAVSEHAEITGQQYDSWEERTVLLNIVRKELFQQLRNTYPEIQDWKALSDKNYFHFQSALKRSIIEVLDVKNVPLEEIPAGKSKRAAYKEANLMRCFTKKEHANMTVYEDEERHVTGYSCKEKYCTCCADQSAFRTTKKLVQYLTGVIEATNAQAFHRFVFTLPKEVERDIPKGSALRKQYKKKIERLIYRTFGLNYRDHKLSIYMSFHRSGDKDPMRDRYHLHVGVLANFAVKKANKKKGTKQELMLLDTPKQLPADQLQLLHQRYVEKLNEVFEPKTPFTQAVLNVSYVDLTTKPEEWQAKLTHRIKYDMRAFGKDFREHALYWSPSTNLVVVRAGETEAFGYRVVHMDAYAKRWGEIKDSREFSTHGLLRGREKNGEFLGIQEFADEIPAEIDVVRVEVERKRGRVIEKYQRPGHFKKSVRFKKIEEDLVFELLPDGSRGKQLEPDSYKMGMRGKNRYWAAEPRDKEEQP